ncbi:ATP-dependent RNA helicase DDX20 [Asbolus verrucosus]|uniref:RNA helicase n=1 Tax=Asbolus verrucosus TaxID=1661398 RepID=A0A482W7G1_ASBVE|nr:ATP-dependent RNA helicase DDX20 [Asbolus verrucosus]
MHSIIAHDLAEKPRTKDVILEESVNFTSLLLPNHVLKGLTECGFRKPSPIQFKAIPLGRCGFGNKIITKVNMLTINTTFADLIVKSKSGTGKTLVFSTVALETVIVARNQLQVLILVPTREIAVQIQDVIRGIGCFVDGLMVESFIGGLPVEEDVKKAKQCHIAVGAPGRVKHLISLGALSTEFVRLFVLDEADKLMETSFQGDINEIYNSLPQRKQLIASSATYPQELDTFLTNYMLSPTHVSSENETPILLGLKQFVAVIKTSNPNVVQLMKSKNEKLLEIFSKISFTQCLVFSNYQTRAESISNYLNQKGWNSTFISAAQSQTKRLEAVNNLKEFKNRILLSTDLTSRGIDAPNVDLVINYDIPQDAVTYLHRMGRAGRYGSSGICINLALDGDELKQLQTILGMIGATNVSISILPLLNEKSIDLWQQDVNIFEQICGIVPSNTLNKFSENIKNEVMAIKQVKRDTVNSIEEYLSLLKAVETQESNWNSVEEILNFHENNTDEHPKTNEMSKRTDEKEIIEDIFKLGYECAVGKERKNWFDCLPQEELLSFRDLCKDDIVISSDSDEQEDEEEQDYEMENFIEEENEVKGEESFQNQDGSLQWVPVVHTENSSDLQSEHFTKCYEDCSNVLWQNGLTFETVEEFDDWYYHWQEELHSVRTYVQQNIYVEEMSKYQQNRLTHK